MAWRGSDRLDGPLVDHGAEFMKDVFGDLTEDILQVLHLTFT